MFRLAVICFCVSSIWALPSSPRNSKLSPFKRTGPRIINGDEASEGQFPWQTGIYITADDGYFFCGGSIISEEWILTAGHCVLGAQSAQVVTGTLDANNGLFSNASTFILHEGYDDYTTANDIGLIKLDTPLELGGNTDIVNLATDELEADVDITVSGWGLTSDSGSTISESLNYVELRTITNDDCNQYYGPGAVLPEMVCANSPTSEVRGTCNGDSGGPVIINPDSNPIHVAIVSFVSNQGCESGIPSGYTRTAYYRDWIKENAGV